MPDYRLAARLLAAAASISLLGLAAQASAQTATVDEALAELVVTATKQSETINKVPLSITAVTQNSVYEQGLKTVQDLSRIVPALQISTSNVANGSNISVRGISSTLGAATTAVYLDDVALQRRTTAGTFSGSGVIFPQLFDLERVEVLRGPQGTLYGGSAQGGAIRFITPTPSLVEYSALGRAELATTKDGAMSYEAGFGVGGPIVADKLGFRISVLSRREGGYIDHVYINTGQTLGENTNTDHRSALRAVLLWRPTEKLSIAPAIYASRENHKDADSYWANIPAVTVPTAYFNAAGAAVPANGAVNFTLPGYTYGPYNFLGPYKSGLNCNIGANFVNQIAPCYGRSPRTSGLLAANVTAEYELGFATAHSTTAYVVDRNKGAIDSSFGDNVAYQAGVPFLYTFPWFFGRAVYKNRREAFTEEFRLASTGAGKLNWVAGLFYTYQRTRAESHDFTNLKDYAPALRGVPDVLIFGAPVAPDGDVSARFQVLKEKEFAIFGEAGYQLTEKLKLIAGGRVARTSFDYDSILYGSFFGFSSPTVENGGVNVGKKSQTSFSPKVGLQYALSETDNLYFTAAKGFRVGGVNTGSFRARCNATFAQLGIEDTPREYDSDSLWSYEVGAKVRTLGGRAQINTSAFYIDWSNVQVNYTLPAPCGFSYVANAGGAVSKGGDIQANVRLVGGLSGSVQAAYTDAYYTDALVGPAPTSAIFIRKGDKLPTPAFSYNLGLRYDFLAGAYGGYVRADYQWAGAYKRGFGPGSSSYNIDTYSAEATSYLSARAAVGRAGVELALFANNIFNSQDVLTRTGGRACSNAACTVVRQNNPVFSETTFRPRTIGLTLTYRR